MIKIIKPMRSFSFFPYPFAFVISLVPRIMTTSADIYLHRLLCLHNQHRQGVTQTLRSAFICREHKGELSEDGNSQGVERCNRKGESRTQSCIESNS